MLNINFSLFSSKGEIHFQILDACSLFRMKYNVSSVKIRYMCISVTMIILNEINFTLLILIDHIKKKITQLNIVNVLKYE